MGKKVEYLVVDTTAFIKNESLQNFATNVYTVQEVVDEIRNKRQLRNLVVLPYDLKIKEVFTENVKYVTEFSKKTGDYPSLSATDIKVMALTYQLEKEKVGSDHLPQDPEVNRIINCSTYPSQVIPTSELSGFYVPSKKDSSPISSESKNEDLVLIEKTTKELSQKFASLDCSNINEFDDMEDDSCLILVKDSDDTSNVNQNDATCDERERLDEVVDNDSCEEESDDEGGWITVENIDRINKELENGIGEEQDVVVACTTSDFAMQNVLKQMGLHVLTVDGRQIHQLRTFILRCYACFKTTSIMTKIFCPNCGNKTLKKVGVSLAEDGTQHIHINTRRPLTARGKKFSLPTPAGGKHASNPYLCEDQRFPHQRPTRLAREKNNPMDPDYIAGYSPFVMRDVNSRSAILGIHGSESKYWMKKNPNECKQRRK